ncbi:ATP-dependent DNA ligase [Paenibacillus koleovorans]|uniref:ATP-dependent DNA ligase n=1 Tax=Paenibacillus koleovorans TaxID=121608 RepID=UPI001FE2A261|nr:DNA ligase [Paenibacillus koleovorans]
MLFTPLKPMLPVMGRQAFDDDRFLFEPKWDGGRILLHKDGARLEAYTRFGQSVTWQFPELREVGVSIHERQAVLDCEGICLRDGRAVFDDFAQRLRLQKQWKIDAAAGRHHATFVVLDVLYSGDERLNEPLHSRKERLAQLIEPSRFLMPTMFARGQGLALHTLSVAQEMEGIVAKRLDSVYRLDRRSEDWIKIKNTKTIDAVILGYRTEPRFGLVVGLHFRSMRNKPVAVVEDGISEEERAAFLRLVRPLHTQVDESTRTQYIESVLCCRIQYRDRTDMHQLRLTTFVKFLPDKKPEECWWTY